MGGLSVDQDKRLRDRRRGPHDLVTGIAEDVLHFERKQGVVLDDQHSW